MISTDKRKQAAPVKSKLDKYEVIAKIGEGTYGVVL